MTSSGPESTELDKRIGAVMMPTYGPLPLLPARAFGCDVEDQDGKHYLDLAGGIAVNALGHCHPVLVEALTTQANKLWHLSNVFANDPALTLAETLVANTFADKVFFSNSGAEANEAALKLARRYAYDHSGPDKHEIIALQKAFHGRTFFTVSTGGTPEYATGFGPLPPGIVHVPPNDIDQMAAAIGPQTAAVILEPIVAEGGIISLDTDYLAAVRDLCDANGALLIFDEVQTGVGRTGTLYAHEQLGVTPDIISSAKALGGGFPIAATLARAEVAASFVKGTHGSTYGGNPLGCAVANAVLGEVTKPELLANVAARSAQLRDGLATIGKDTGIFDEIRGRGLLIGAAMSEEFLGRAKEVQLAAVSKGLLMLIAGPDVCRLTPALNITEAEADLGLERLAVTAANFAK